MCCHLCAVESLSILLPGTRVHTCPCIFSQNTLSQRAFRTTLSDTLPRVAASPCTLCDVICDANTLHALVEDPRG